MGSRFTIFTVGILLVTTLLVGCWIRSYFVRDRLSVVSAREYAAVSFRGLLTLESISCYTDSLMTSKAQEPPKLERVSATVRFGYQALSARAALAYVRGGSIDRLKAFQTERRIVSMEIPSSDDKDDLVRTRWRWRLRLPYWAVVICAASPGIAVGARLFFRRRYRARHGLCARCGYDLRASTSRCPECGTPFDHPLMGPANGT